MNRKQTKRQIGIFEIIVGLVLIIAAVAAIKYSPLAVTGDYVPNYPFSVQDKIFEPVLGFFGVCGCIWLSQKHRWWLLLRSLPKPRRKYYV